MFQSISRFEPMNCTQLLYKHASLYISGLVCWIIALGMIAGWSIPQLFELDAWWHYVLLVIIGLPLSMIFAVLGFLWLGALTTSLNTFGKDLEMLAESWSAERKRGLTKFLKIIHFAYFSPLLLAFVSSLLNRTE